MWKLLEPRSTAASRSPSASGGDASGGMSGLADLGEQRALGRERHLVADRGDAAVLAVRVQAPGVLVVGEVVGQLLVVDAPRQFRVEDREAGLDAAQQVAFHPFGARAEHLRRAAVAEPVHARM